MIQELNILYEIHAKRSYQANLHLVCWWTQYRDDAWILKHTLAGPGQTGWNNSLGKRNEHFFHTDWRLNPRRGAVHADTSLRLCKTHPACMAN